MTNDTLLSSDQSLRVSLEDITIRERQLEAHLLHSPEYLQRAHGEITRQVVLLYFAIGILILFQGLFTWKTAGHVPMRETVLTSLTALFAIINCLLLIRTKAGLRHLNEKWLQPEERRAMKALRSQRTEISRLCLERKKKSRPELNESPV